MFLQSRKTALLLCLGALLVTKYTKQIGPHYRDRPYVFYSEKLLASFFRILPEHSLVYARYSGEVTIDDYLGVVEGVQNHPDFRIEFKHLIDLMDLTEIKLDYVKVMKAQAQIAGLVANATSDILSVVVAPTPIALQAAKMVLRSWDDLDTPVVRRIVSNLTQAAVLLGLPKNTLLDLQKQIS